MPSWNFLQIANAIHLAFSIRTRHPNSGNQQLYHWATPLKGLSHNFFSDIYDVKKTQKHNEYDPGAENADLGFKISFLFQFLVLVVSEKMLLNTILVSEKWLLHTKLVGEIWLLDTQLVSGKWSLDTKLVSGKWLLGSI